MTASILAESASPVVSDGSPVVRYTVSLTEGVVLDEPRRVLGYNWLDTLIDELRAERVSRTEARYLLARTGEIESALDRVVADARTEQQPARGLHFKLHSRAQSSSRKRKTSATCLRCQKLRKPCYQHRGGSTA